MTNDKPRTIEAARLKRQMTQEEFARFAGVTLRSYLRFLAGRHVTRPHVLKRLSAAARNAPLPPPDPRLIAAMHGSAVALYAAALGVDPRAAIAGVNAAAGGSSRAAFLAEARVRRLAMYHLVVEIGIASCGALARAIGCTKQNVSLAIAAIEDEREPGSAVDRLIQSIPL